jgi:hypothetical protein
MNARTPHPSISNSQIRMPQRKRGIARFEHLLDATEILLVERPDEDISLALVAATANVPLPSIYTLSPAEAEFDGLTARSETIQLCL